MNKQDVDRMNKAMQTLYEVCEKAQKTLEVVARIVLQMVKGSYVIVEKYLVVLLTIGGLLKRKEKTNEVPL